MKKCFICGVLLSTAMGHAAAQDWSVQPVIGMKAQFGGDPLATIYYTDGTEQDLLAGQGIDFYAGVLLKQSPYSVKASLGYKYSSSMATNIDVAKTALPFNLTGRYDISSGFFVGGGLTHHFSPQLAIDTDTYTYESSLGYHLELGWEAISIGWTSVTYDESGAEFDASTFDVNLELVF
ncbi:hypothetical protein [Reinekea blandensis]|uniref:Outer membrane protein beta-barrel domain-containing protein n=1 Tax=Reinekea blandensis MED297 TaxID=314283 RepID=A4BD47_9GAMM|nr:hypothetical protein [Reinekea blandensis]EAR09791.1 hypothetical protein MED297_05564 [Reinekea sp. MED297] [Reinekea blandensis MED297]